MVLNADNLNKFQRFFYNYGIYHHDKINILIHVICVPIIVSTLMIILRTYVGTVHITDNFEFNWGWMIFVLSLPVYLKVDVLVGLFTVSQYFVVDYFFHSHDFSFKGYTSFQVVVALHLIGWIAQFIGHGAFEGRKPALMDNIFLTINAPVFVNLEVLYYSLGYRKEELDETQKYIMEEVRLFRKQFIKKSS